MIELKTVEYKNHRIDIFADEDAWSPREWDNLGTMACWHRRYDLGDKNDMTPDEFRTFMAQTAGVYLPVYMYDHSGITISTSRTGVYADRWDAGQLGFIYVTNERIREEYGVRRVSKKLQEKVAGILRDEVTTYDQYLRGEVYGMQVYDGLDAEAEILEGCWGFYEMDYAINEGKAMVDVHVKNVYHQIPLPEVTNA